MDLRQAELALAGFIETTAVPALRALPFPDLGVEGDPIYLKLITVAFVPVSFCFLFAAVARGRITLHRFLGLYLLIFVVMCTSGWFHFQVAKADAGTFTQVSIESVLHHVLAAFLVASVYFALQRPGFPRSGPPQGSTYVRLWGTGLSLLAYGYSQVFLPQRQFLLVRLLATLAFPAFSLQYLFGGHLIQSFGMKGFSTTLSTLFPLLYTLLTAAVSYQLGFVSYHADSVMGFRFFGMPVEEIASYAQLCTLVVQGLLIWEALAAPVPQRRQEPRARLVPMSKTKASAGSSATPKAKSSDTPSKQEKENPVSPSTTADKASKSPPTSHSSSPKPKNSPQKGGGKKASA